MAWPTWPTSIWAAGLAKYILNESERRGRTTFALNLTQAEMGQLLGGARQTINQAARSLHDAGLVGLDGRTVTIIDEEGLRLRAMSADGRLGIIIRRVSAG